MLGFFSKRCVISSSSSTQFHCPSSPRCNIVPYPFRSGSGCCTDHPLQWPPIRSGRIFFIWVCCDVRACCHDWWQGCCSDHHYCSGHQQCRCHSGPPGVCRIASLNNPQSEVQDDQGQPTQTSEHAQATTTSGMATTTPQISTNFLRPPRAMQVQQSSQNAHLMIVDLSQPTLNHSNTSNARTPFPQMLCILADEIYASLQDSGWRVKLIPKNASQSTATGNNNPTRDARQNSSQSTAARNASGQPSRGRGRITTTRPWR